MLTALLLAAASYAQTTGSDLTLPVVSPQGRFEFHSDRWLNLHHFLYHWSRAHDAREQKLWGRVRLDPEDAKVELGDAQAAWDAASAAYLKFVDRPLLNGEGMRQLKVAISKGPASWPAETPFTQLKAVMPIYEEHWWPRHDARNRELIRTLLPLLEAHEVAIAGELAEQYESRWPDAPVDVQVSYYTNWAGAYTSWGPNLIMIASGSKKMPGHYLLETVFHEAGHTVPLGEKIRSMSLEIAGQIGVDEGDVWHALLFHVTGEAVRGAVGSQHVPYAEEFGLWKRGSWDGLHPIIEQAFSGNSGLHARLTAIHRQRAARD